VLFSDLVGSSEIAAHLDSEDWREIAAQYQLTADTAVTRFGGHVAKYLGDGLMVYFGGPGANEDAAETCGPGWLGCRGRGRCAERQCATRGTGLGRGKKGD
jgi:class 3 adenylate cyclase